MNDPMVTVFTHEKSDATHLVIDRPAIVLGGFEDPVRGQVLRVKVFAWGEAPYDLEVSEFPAEAPVDALGNIVYGGTYWRPWGAPHPDFEAAYDAKQQALYEVEKAKLDERQAHELENTPEAKLEAQTAVHEHQQLVLAHKYGRPAPGDEQPAQEHHPQPVM